MIGLALFFSPLPLFLLYVYFRRLFFKGRLLTARLVAQAAESKPYDPAPEPSPGRWMRRFNPGERRYLRDQWSTARAGFCIVAWFFLTVLGSSLLPREVERNAGSGSPLALLVWASFLRSAGLQMYSAIFLGIVTGFTIGSGFSETAGGFLNRTRPLSRRFCFWGRTLPGLLALVTGNLVGVGLCFVLLVCFYGPVWQHVGLPNSPYAAGLPGALIQGRAGASFAPVAFASIMMAMLLACSLFVLLATRPFGGKLRSNSMPRWVVLCIAPSSYALFATMFGTARRHGFLYVAGRHPPASPWMSVWVPLLVAVVTLRVAQFFFARSEY